MHDLIGRMLQPNPQDRASIFEIEEILNKYDSITEIIS
jgi:AP2-associated kinase